MSDQPLIAHSLAEAHLYLMAVPCESCKRGSLRGGEATAGVASDDQTIYTIVARCSACGAENVHTFQVSAGAVQPPPGEPAVVNPTAKPSRILDVGQWIVLFRVITEAAANEKDKVQARHLGLEAAQCLDEALKFYDDPENELPPDEAVFTESTARRLREAPEQFSRTRLIELRGKLPTTAAMRKSLGSSRKTETRP